ncbi:hypothetical protein, partial [Rothia terrae]
MATLVAPGGTTDIPDAVLEKIGELALKDVHGISSQSNPTASAFGRIRDLVNKHSENNPTTVNVSSGDNALTVEVPRVLFLGICLDFYYHLRRVLLPKIGFHLDRGSVPQALVE